MVVSMDVLERCLSCNVDLLAQRVAMRHLMYMHIAHIHLPHLPSNHIHSHIYTRHMHLRFTSDRRGCSAIVYFLSRSRLFECVDLREASVCVTCKTNKQLDASRLDARKLQVEKQELFFIHYISSNARYLVDVLLLTCK